MDHSNSRSDPTDFHQLKARFKIPLAPVFLTKPSRSKLSSHLLIKKDEDEIQSEFEALVKEEEKPNLTLEDFTGTSGALDVVNESLASLLMKYVPCLGSVLVAYLEPPIFISTDQDRRQIRRVGYQTPRLSFPTLSSNGWGVVDVEVELMGWRPTIGQKLIGRTTLSSPSHLSLVIYRTFNASIPENHLRSAGCHYDLNVQVPANWKTNHEPANLRESSSSAETAPQHRSNERGCWIDATGKIVGGSDGIVSFTVIGLTIANQMISVIGSLHKDPFSIDSIVPPRRSNLRNLNNRQTNIPFPEESSDEDQYCETSVAPSIYHPQSPPRIRLSDKSNAKSNADQLLPLTSKNLQAISSSNIKHSEPLHETRTRDHSSNHKKVKSSSSKKKKNRSPITGSKIHRHDPIQSNSSIPTLHPQLPPTNGSQISSPSISRKRKLKTK